MTAAFGSGGLENPLAYGIGLAIVDGFAFLFEFVGLAKWFAKFPLTSIVQVVRDIFMSIIDNIEDAITVASFIGTTASIGAHVAEDEYGFQKFLNSL